MTDYIDTIVNAIEYEFYVESLEWEMLFSVDYEVTPGEPEGRREKCEITKALLIRIKSDVSDDMHRYDFCHRGVHLASGEAILFGNWFMAWIAEDEDDRAKLHEACFAHAGRRA